MAITAPVWTAGELLAKARRDAHITVAQMAELLGVSHKTINNYETGRTHPRKATVERWAEHCDAAWLTWESVRDLLFAASGWLEEFAVHAA